MPFFHSLSVPEIWEWIFLFPSRSQSLVMELSIPASAPELPPKSHSRSRSPQQNDQCTVVRNDGDG